MIKTVITNYNFNFKLNTVVSDSDFDHLKKKFKTVVINYDFKLKVKAIVDEYDFEFF